MQTFALRNDATTLPTLRKPRPDWRKEQKKRVIACQFRQKFIPLQRNSCYKE